MHSTTSGANKAIVSYVPALHAGYIALFSKHPGTRIFVLGKSFIDAFPRLNRDLRALPPVQIVSALIALGFEASVLEIDGASTLENFSEIIMPDEDVTRDFAEKYLSKK